jgi:hypothetical protein
MTMNVDCKERERIFEDGTPGEWAALESHAANCAACAEEIRAWQALSVAAKELRDDSDSSALWTRIERALVEEAAPKAKSKAAWGWLSSWNFAPAGWQTALVGAFVLLLAISGGWFFFHSNDGSGSHNASLLRSKALNEVERTESAYVQAIDKLAADAKLQLDNPATPLLSSYREKLLLIDSAIDELRSQAGQNPSNAHLRYQLLAMYQEKQRTLEEILEEKR